MSYCKSFTIVVSLSIWMYVYMNHIVKRFGTFLFLENEINMFMLYIRVVEPDHNAYKSLSSITLTI